MRTANSAGRSLFTIAISRTAKPKWQSPYEWKLSVCKRRANTAASAITPVKSMRYEAPSHRGLGPARSLDDSNCQIGSIAHDGKANASFGIRQREAAGSSKEN